MCSILVDEFAFFSIQMAVEVETSKKCLLNRQVAEFMPLCFDMATGNKTKKKEVASFLIAMIEGYEEKEIYKAVGKRQDQQKYLTEHLRAKAFLAESARGINFSTMKEKDLKTKISDFYKKKSWVEPKGGAKKVILPKYIKYKKDHIYYIFLE